MKKNIVKLLSIMMITTAVVFLGCGKAKQTGEETQESTAATIDIESKQEPAINLSLDEQAKQPENGEAAGPESAVPESGENVVQTTNPSVPSPSICGTLKVDGANLVDENGNPVQLKGISTAGLAWFPEYVNAECFKQLHEEWNVSVIRLAMYTMEYKGFLNGGDQDAMKELIKNGVKYATDEDMYVIIDWHILSDGNPSDHTEEAKNFFSEMSKEFSDHNNVIYEICNEPNGNGASWSVIKEYAEQVIPQIRQNDEDALILVGTPQWSQLVDEAAKGPITDYDNIMYSLHFYAATHKEWLQNTLEKANDDGLPIFVSEYGICEASGDGNLDKESAQKWIDLLNKRNISYVAWTLENKAEAGAIVKCSCVKTSGFEKDELTDYGQWLYEMLTKTSEE